MAISKDTWRAKWLKCISELSAFELQRKKWLKPDGNLHWSFTEFMNSYFDDLPLNNDRNYSDYIELGFVTQEEYNVLKEWHTKLENYQPPNSEDWNNVAVLNDPKWKTIVALGLEVKSELATLVNPQERGYLQDPA